MRRSCSQMRGRYNRPRNNRRRDDRVGPFRSRSGIILGVCKGLADYFNVSVFWVRVLAVLAFFFGGIWPAVGIYLVAALLLKPEPVVPFGREEEREFYNSYSASKNEALQRLKRTFDHLDRRLRRMEDIVTDKEFDWERRFKSNVR